MFRRRFVVGRALAAAAVVLAGSAPRAQQGNEYIIPSTPMAEPRAFHGTAVMGENLYVFGGSMRGADGREAPTTSVRKARVLPNGMLGQWEDTTSLTQPRHYIDNSTLVLNDVVYIIGGAAGPLEDKFYNTAVYTRPLPNGTLLPWSESAPFGEGVATVTAVSTPGHIHIVGGLGKGAVPVREVWSNSIYSDGSMGAWTQGPSLPFPLWYHSAGAVAGRVYVWGGLPTKDKSPVSQYVLSAPILGSGKLGEWRTENVQLPQPFYGAASSVAGPFLISLSPRYAGGPLSNHLWFAQATPDGLTKWSPRQTMVPNQVYHACAPDYRHGYIYLSGGRPDRGKGLLADTSVFRLTPAARQLAEQGWMAAQLAHANTVAALPPPTTGDAVKQVKLSYMAESQLHQGAAAGFQSYFAARDSAASGGKALVIYFNLDGAPPCEEQRAHLGGDAFRQLLPAASFAWVNTEEYPQLVQQLGVYRVPTWVIYDKRGNEIQSARRIGVQTAADLAKLVLPLR